MADEANPMYPDSWGATAKAKAALGGIVSFSPGAHEVVASYVVT